MVAKGPLTVDRVSAGTSGWSYPTWRPGFYPAGLDPSFRIAFDLEHPSWDGIEPRLAGAGAVRVNDLDHPAQFRYLRLREPPYDDAALQELAARLRAAAETSYVYFRHEDAPTAPAYAQRLLDLLASRRVPSEG